MTFDEWRAAYDSMTINDQIEAHQKLFELYPDQHQHSDDGPARAFFEDLPGSDHRVLEVGGWTGDAAATLLPGQKIAHWRNVELSPAAVSAPHTLDPRYTATVPLEWPWDPWWSGYDVLFLQHVVEHIRFAQFKQLIWHIPDVDYIFIQAPLGLDPRDWAGYQGTHILEVGWTGIVDFLAAEGFGVRSASIDPGHENSSTYTFALTWEE